MLKYLTLSALFDTQHLLHGKYLSGYIHN